MMMVMIMVAKKGIRETNIPPLKYKVFFLMETEVGWEAKDAASYPFPLKIFDNNKGDGFCNKKE